MLNIKKKEFPIPTLNDEQWKGLQASLKDISTHIKEIEKLKEDFNKQVNEKLELIDINLGLIDSFLGRTYTVDEVVERIRQAVEEKERCSKENQN